MPATDVGEMKAFCIWVTRSAAASVRMVRILGGGNVAVRCRSGCTYNVLASGNFFYFFLDILLLRSVIEDNLTT